MFQTTTKQGYGVVKLTPEELSKTEWDLSKILGSWSQSEELINKLHEEYENASPFPHVVIDDFLSEETCKQSVEDYPTFDPDCRWWHEYKNPIENKYAFDCIEKMKPGAKNLFSALSSEPFVKLLRRLTGIETLEMDPYLHGAGCHYHPKGGKLSLHLDYSIHPFIKKERRINIILFLNDDWKEEYKGFLELWSSKSEVDPYAVPKTEDLDKCERKVAPLLNRAIIFRTSEQSWHGLPDEIQCPEDKARRSYAFFYVSDIRDSTIERKKAFFVQRPGDPYDPRFITLANIRKDRLLTYDDISKLDHLLTKND